MKFKQYIEEQEPVKAVGPSKGEMNSIPMQRRPFIGGWAARMTSDKNRKCQVGFHWDRDKGMCIKDEV